jgi:prepilin-type N-terminal cleavage/methylation domain-containing protein
MYVAHPGSGRRRRPALARRLREERGFTLIELLVGISAGVIVTMATMYILIVSIHLTSNTDDRVDANQQGRLAMQRIVQALNSSCVSASVPPIVAGSTATNLVFYSNTTQDAATINPNQVTISYTAGADPALTMNTQTYASGAYAYPSPTYTFTSPGTTSTLLEYARPATVNGSATSAIFSYYGYTNGTLNTTAYSTPLSASNAANTAEVLVQFQSLPSDSFGSSANSTTTANIGNRGTNFSDQVVLRLTPASSNSGESNTPCS